MSQPVILIVLALSLVFIDSDAHAGNKSDVCALLKKEKWPAAYLLNKDGDVSEGPVDFERYVYTLNKAVDFIDIPTTYRVVIWPKRIVVGEAFIFGSFELKPTKSVCPNATTYEVSYFTRGFPTFNPEQLPYKVDQAAANFPPMEDPQDPSFTESSLHVRFNSRVVGEIVDGRRK